MYLFILLRSSSLLGGSIGLLGGSIDFLGGSALSMIGLVLLGSIEEKRDPLLRLFSPSVSILRFLSIKMNTYDISITK